MLSHIAIDAHIIYIYYIYVHIRSLINYFHNLSYILFHTDHAAKA